MLASTRPTFAVDAALARAVVYQMLSIAFQPPTEIRLARIGGRDRFCTVVAALRFLDESRQGPLAAAASHLASLSVPDVDHLSACYFRLFGHTARGLVCLCETEYGPGNGFHQPQQLADIAGYYVAFGLRATNASEARPDHLASECEFMDFLNRKTAHLGERVAVDASEFAETLELTQAAEWSFLRDHLGRFGRAAGNQLVAEDREGYFGAVGHLLVAFVEAECARVGVRAGPTDLALRPEEPDDTPMACGSADQADQLISIQGLGRSTT